MKFVSARAFKAAIKRDRKAADDLVVRKLFVSQPEQADDDLIRFTITTSGVDRERDVLELDGWELGNYRATPSCSGGTKPGSRRSAAPSICSARARR